MGIAFPNFPGFKSLREDDISEADKKKLAGGVDPKLTMKQFEKEVKKSRDGVNKIKKKRKTKRDPTPKQIRDHLRKIVDYHKHMVDESIPSIYPLLGAANTDSDDSGDSENEKRLHTKEELKRY